ncbi:MULTISPECIES: SpoIVB peptidase [Paenibacillus]|uniref:Stage IV sporulation protein B n=1 Tax=Paenibacillus tundrae TaxID=528187 RepID=A0ABT9W6Y3_9BACL|nr:MULTISPECIES: SpoIVB peptidase [Paenibacillus]MDQ0168989.1 stage IV sporulation protein B [Paenibacillus tundrae]
MNSPLRKKLLGLLFAFFLCLISQAIQPVQSYASLPDEVQVFAGRQAEVRLAVPATSSAVVDRPDIVGLDGQEQAVNVTKLEPLHLHPQQTGHAKLTLKLWGKIPVKTVNVNVIPDLRVVPGGQTIGVKVKSAGILVVGHHLIGAGQDQRVSPGEDAGIKLGDLITHMDGKRLEGVSGVAEAVERAGKSKKGIDVVLKRGNETVKTRLTPAYDAEDQAWRLGLYIRDSAAGVGTLTFYAPDQGVYGALGHVITDMNTQTSIVVGSGQIVQSNVTSISKSESGDPGEKRAHFLKESKILGNIERNTAFGIFGKMSNNPDHSLYSKGIPVAFSREVKEGPAEILTVVEGQQVERYSIDIVHVADQSEPATKGLVLRITDPKLIEKTGGIVQGMSGSPIVQNGKLIGAVTHVFVNDPKSGYGCFIEWMLQDAGVMLKKETSKNLKAG